MFGENLVEDITVKPDDIVNGLPVRLLRVVRWLNITVVKGCSEFPYLEMDEACKYCCWQINSGSHIWVSCIAMDGEEFSKLGVCLEVTR